MLHTLNDDCLNLICDYLPMEDHLSLSKSSNHLFQIIANYYETHNKVTLDRKIWLKDKKQRRKFLAAFRRNIGPYVKELNVENIDVEHLDLLDQLPLKKVTTLELQLFNAEESSKAKLDKYLSSLCANLKKLTLEGVQLNNTIAAHKFPNVTQLHVNYYREQLDISVEMFPALTNLKLHGSDVNVFMLCGLKNLTTLELDHDYLKQEELHMILGALVLKKFAIGDDTALTIDGISKCQSLEELVFDCYDDPIEELTKLKNLQRVAVTGVILPMFQLSNAICKYLCLTEREVLELSNLNLATKLKNLKHLKIYSPRNFSPRSKSNYNAMLNILKNSPKMRVLEIWDSEFYTIEILEMMVQHFSNIYGERTESLSILCCNMSEDELRYFRSFESLLFPDFVKLSFKGYVEYYYQRPELHCDWQATSG